MLWAAVVINHVYYSSPIVKVIVLRKVVVAYSPFVTVSMLWPFSFYSVPLCLPMVIRAMSHNARLQKIDMPLTLGLITGCSLELLFIGQALSGFYEVQVLHHIWNKAIWWCVVYSMHECVNFWCWWRSKEAFLCKSVVFFQQTSHHVTSRVTYLQSKLRKLEACFLKYERSWGVKRLRRLRPLCLSVSLAPSLSPFLPPSAQEGVGILQKEVESPIQDFMWSCSEG